MIGNGLRPSNIIELRIDDLKAAKTEKRYEGHKIVTNSKYKTGTIYGEKFIVIPCNVYDHYIFYVNELHKLVNYNTSLKHVFLPSFSLSKEMLQAKVPSALTTSSKKANVLDSKKEYQWVSCTRIRVVIAMFACNEGRYETDFIAKYFMKNEEETNGLHYN